MCVFFFGLANCTNINFPQLYLCSTACTAHRTQHTEPQHVSDATHARPVCSRVMDDALQRKTGTSSFH